MRIFTLAEVDGYEWVLPRRERDFDTFRQLDGRRSHRWKPVAVTLVDRDDDGRPLAPADTPWMGRHILIVRDDAIDRTATVLGDHGELLPLTCDSARVAAFNPGPMLDALDEERSGIVRFSSGRVMDIEHYTFDTSLIPERASFKIVQDPTGPVFFTETLAADLTALGLSGLDFEAIDGSF